jgi:hypothetical protein
MVVLVSHAALSHFWISVHFNEVLGIQPRSSDMSGKCLPRVMSLAPQPQNLQCIVWYPYVLTLKVDRVHMCVHTHTHTVVNELLDSEEIPRHMALMRSRKLDME